ncbi:MAG: glycosyltransferase family 2 protein, partial [Caulobacteraceae bacterium]|nr:glycosyltransferase family 2 protein [Caulobacter sp.]
MSEAVEAAGGPAPGAVADDVVRAYRLLLGREPGATEIVPRLGSPLEALLRSIADSPEHVEQVLSPLLAGAPFPQGRYPAPPEPADAAWLQAQAPGAPVSGETGGWRGLLRCARVFLQLAPPPPAPSAAVLPHDPHAPATPAEVEAAFQLVLGRPAEEAARQGFAGAPAGDLALALLASEEFRLVTWAAAAEGRLGAPAAPVAIGALAWLRARFGLDLPAYAPRDELLAALLRAPALAPRLQAAPLAWSPAALAEMLDAQAALDVRERDRPRLIDELQRRSAGVELLRLQDMEREDAGRARFTSADPAVFFRLSPELADAPAVELAFTVADARRRASGVLYLDYGDGFSEAASLSLRPKGRRVHHALVAHPGRLAGLRWDPDDQPGQAWIAALSARRVEAAEFEGRLAQLPAAELALAAAAPREAFDAELSRRLTAHAHGRPADAYAEWIAENEPAAAEAQRVWAAELEALSSRPRIAVLVPLYDTPEPLLRAMIESVLAQVYPDWELCLADDASPTPHVREVVEAYMAQDPRIKAVFREKNGHISEASNSALELVTADWLALLDHDDILTPDALLAVAGEIDRHPEARFVYSDEDKIDEAGRRFDVFFKPDFSPELLRSQNYLNHLSVHRTEAIRAVGGWRKGFEGSQDYDLNLRTLERLDPREVRHIPRVLYHWRAIAGSTALAVGEKNYAVEAGLRALSEHLERMEWDATAGMVPGLPFYRVRYEVPDPAPLVSVIIPTRDRADLLSMCVDSVLEKTTYPNYEILIADNGSTEPATFALFERLTADPRVRVVEAPGPFNYSRINNDAVRESAGELVCLLNNDIEVITPDWMREMASWALQPRIGCVGAKLYYPNDTIQHAGVVMGLGGVAGHGHKHRHRNDPGYFGRIAVAHDVSVVTGACLIVRRAVWDASGGLNEQLAVAFNDVDFCLRVRDEGCR